ncbi:ROK family transcriptional regulator [Desertibacillus haloalkaliphilus]|uniref:ROK family transcriptional regulator n=1 Tax=Desertibacillus haloalkaliphilus TaxID=1328930 RepID=UPI001C275AAA|nr:ROK family protein [Desertibacillus haloalkaliphilus]MBU8907682.1 ROK family protein [Desertibacillus haloalkaliphilus]
MNINNVIDHKNSKLAIIQTLRIHGSMSRIMLTEFTGFSRATVSATISELMDMGIIKETKKQPSTGGRPATTLELVPYSTCVVGACLDNNHWKIGAFDLLDHVINSIDIPVYTQDPIETFEVLKKNLLTFIDDLDRPILPLLGIGAPGLVDKNDHLIKAAPPRDWFNVNVAEILGNSIDWPIVVMNRHRARGLAECRFGAGSDSSNIIYIGVGSGVRAGFYINRQLITDSMGGTGELGHTTVEPNGPLCSCGNEGCLQMLCSSPFIEKQIRKSIRFGETPGIHLATNGDMQSIKATDVCRAADRGDTLSIEVINKAATYLGITMANLVNTFNPETIILGGTIPNASELFVETSNKIMRQRALPSIVSNVNVLSATLGDNGGALGAANFALDRKLPIKYLNPALS